ncbi:DMT family transporter [soil metagenome]
MLAAFAAVGYGAGDFLGGLATRVLPVMRTVLWAHVVGLAFVGGWVVAAGVAPSGSDLVAGAAAGLFGLVGLVFLYSGLARGRSAVVAPAATVLGALIPVGAGVALGERPNALSWLGVALAFPANYLVSTVPGLRRRSAGLGHGLAAGLFFGCYFVVFAQTSGESGLWPLLASRVASVVLVGLVAAAAFRSRLYPPPRGVRGAVVGVGLVDLGGNVAYLLASEHSPLVVVAVVASLFPAVTVALARLIHAELLTSGQMVGLGAGIGAVALLSVG